MVEAIPGNARPSPAGVSMPYPGLARAIRRMIERDYLRQQAEQQQGVGT